MIKFCVEDIIIEKLTEYSLNVIDLLQGQIPSPTRCKPFKFKYVYQGNETDIEKVVVLLAGVGINIKKEDIIVDKTWDCKKHINDKTSYILVNSEDST